MLKNQLLLTFLAGNVILRIRLPPEDTGAVRGLQMPDLLSASGSVQFQ